MSAPAGPSPKHSLNVTGTVTFLNTTDLRTPLVNVAQINALTDLLASCRSEVLS